jgi:hypothetical protein
LLEAVAEFAATLTSPLAAGGTLALAFALQRPARVRLAGGLVGALHAAPDLAAAADGPFVAALVLAAALGAGLLLAEICVHFVLPAWRLATALAAWTLAVLRVAAARLGLRGPRRGYKSGPGAPH